MDDDLLTALYHAASSEESDTMDGPSLCDYYQRMDETEHTRRVLVDTVGDAVDVDSYGVAMECQGFINGFRLALEAGGKQHGISGQQNFLPICLAHHGPFARYAHTGGICMDAHPVCFRAGIQMFIFQR